MPLSLRQRYGFRVISERFDFAWLNLFKRAPGEDAHLPSVPLGPFPMAGTIWRWHGRLISLGAIIIECRHSLSDQRFDRALQVTRPVTREHHVVLVHERR